MQVGFSEVMVQGGSRKATRSRHAQSPVIFAAKPYCDSLLVGNSFARQSLTVQFLTFGVATSINGILRRLLRRCGSRREMESPGVAPMSEAIVRMPRKL